MTEVTVHDPGEPVGPLSRSELAALRKAEGVIERGWRTFQEVGSALLEIRDRRLYRETHESFTTYVRGKWDWPVSRAYQQMYATQVVRFLETVEGIEAMPRNELVARQLGTLLNQGNPELVVEAWSRAVKASDGKPPTAAQTRAAVQETRFLHSDYYKEQIEDPVEKEGLTVVLALPDDLFREVQQSVTNARRGLQSVILPDKKGLRHLDPAWRRKVRKDIDKVIERLQEIAARMDEA